MTKQLPKDRVVEIKDAAYKLADEFGYLSRSRNENGNFIDSLVSNEKVGIVLSSYMPRSEIRTYIKDAILNRYSKDKTELAKPKDVEDIIFGKFNIDSVLIDCDNKSKTRLYKGKGTDKSVFIVVAEGTYIKWETALRKAILYSADKPFSMKEGNDIYILLNVFAQQKKIPNSDKDYLSRALNRIGAKVNFYGEVAS